MTTVAFWSNILTPGKSIIKVNLIIQCLKQWTVRERWKQPHEHIAMEMS